VVDTMNKHGWSMDKPKSTIYIWAPVPEKYIRPDAEADYSSSGAFAADLLEKVGLVVTPGRGYGETGEGFFRISLTYPDATLKQALERMISIL